MVRRSDAGRHGKEVALGRWSPLVVLVTALAIGLTGVQLLTWWIGIANAGGADLYVRKWIDFRPVLTGALLIHEGRGADLYDLAAQHAAQNRVLAPYFTLGPDTTLVFVHLPFTALALAPLMDLPYPVLFALWTALSVLAIGWSLYLLATAVRLPRSIRWAVVTAACAYYPLHLTLWQGQSTPFALLGLCGAYAALKRGREAPAGAALVLLALKPHLLPMVGLLLVLHGRWRALVTFAGLLTALSIGVMPVLGPDWPLRYLQLLAESTTWGSNLGEYPAWMYNWRALIIHLIGPWAPEFVPPIVASLSAGSIGLLVWTCWQQRRADPQPDSPLFTPRSISDPLWVVSVVLTPLIAPHLGLHDLALLIFPGWLIAGALATGEWSRARRYLWAILLWIGSVLPFLGLILLATPSRAVVPNVLFLALAIGLLIWQARGAGWVWPAVTATEAGASPLRPPAVFRSRSAEL